MSESIAEKSFVTHEVFNAYVESFNNRLHDEERLNDMRIERIEAIIEKALTVMHGDNERLEERLNRKFDTQANEFNQKILEIRGEFGQRVSEIRGEVSEIHSEIKRLDTKIDKVEDTLSLSIMGLADRFEDMKDYQNKWFTVFGVLLGVLTIAFSVLAFFK